MANITPLMASVDPWPLDWAPRDWALCQGQLLSISQNTALFALIGTTYGGDGRTTFALPDMRGRIPVGAGQGPSSFYSWGERGGRTSVTLTMSEMPQHNHLINANSSSSRGSSATPDGNFIAQNSVTTVGNFSGNGNSAMNLSAVSLTGGSDSFDIQQPYLAINYIISTNGVFPSRN